MLGRGGGMLGGGMIKGRGRHVTCTCISISGGGKCVGMSRSCDGTNEFSLVSHI